MDIIKRLTELKLYQLLLVGIAASILFTETIVATLSILFRGRITYDYLITGAIAALLVSFVVVYILASLLTERKKAEDEAVKAKAKFHTLFDSFPDAIFVVNMEGRFLDVNHSACERLGYSREELLQMRPTDIDAPEYAAKVPERIKSLMEQGSLIFETAHVSRDGIVIPIEMSDRVIEYDGKPAIIGIARDITDRKKAGECLEKQRQELEIIIDSSPVIIFYKDKGGRFLRVNKTFAEALQIPKERFLGKTVFDLYSANIAQGMTNDDQEVLESGCPKINIVEQYESASGIRWVQTDKVPVFSADGITTGLIGFAQDITERKKAEDSLRESEKTMKAIMNATTDAIFLIDTAGNILAFNETTALRLGKGKDEIIGTCIYDYLSPDKARSRRGYVNEAVGTGKTVSFEDERNGEWIDHSIYPIFDEQGKVEKIAIYGRYVTERKKAEAQIKDSEERFRNLAEQSPNMIFINKRGRVVYVNAKCEEVMKYKRVEFYSPDFDFLCLIAPEFVELARSTFDKHQRGEEVGPFEYAIVSKDGKRIEVMLNSVLIDYEGEKAILGIITDITERKLAEDKLKKTYQELEATQNASLNIMEDLDRESRRLDTSLREREILLQELHHRVKNNLQVLSSLVRLQSRTVKEERYRDMLRDTAGRIKTMSLIHEKLYHSKDLTKIHLKDYIKSITDELLHSYAAAGRISVDQDIAAIPINMNKVIHCGLIINELVSNSIKHAFPRGGKGEVKISLHPVSDKEAELIVSDNGIRLPEGFDIRDTKSLGMQLVTTLAEEQLKGKIELNRDRGTEFRVRFKI